MYYVYLLYSEKTHKFYTGYSTDLKRRIREHRNGKVHTTKRMGHLKLVFLRSIFKQKRCSKKRIVFKNKQGKEWIEIDFKRVFKRIKITEHNPMSQNMFGSWKFINQSRLAL